MKMSRKTQKVAQLFAPNKGEVYDMAEILKDNDFSCRYERREYPRKIVCRKQTRKYNFTVKVQE